MNPSLYPGQDQQVADLAKRIDSKPTDAKVTDTELLSFLDKKDISPDKNVLLETIVSKENEVRKISGLEKAVRDLAKQKITSEDLKKPFSVLNDIQKSIILLNEGLYGGKSITGSEKAIDEKIPANQGLETAKSIPVLTDDLWDKYTLKRTVATISGLPAEYIVNTDEVTLGGDKKTAKISLYMTEKGKLINKEVKDNSQNNDSQTIIKFEKNQDGSRGISKDAKDTDTTLIRLQDGTQVVRLPLSDGSVKDMKFSLNVTNLSFSDHTPDRSYLNGLNNKALGNGAKLGYENKKGGYVEALRAYVDKEHKAYYIADVFVDGKPNGQNMLFDQNGKPLVDQNYEIKARGDKSKESFTTVDNAEKGYVNKNTDGQKRDLQKVIEKGNFETKESDTTVKEVTLSDDLVKSGYVVDHVAGESVYHIANRNTKSSSLLDSGLTITQGQLDKIAKGEKLPVFLKGMNNYYLLTTDTKTNKISLKEDESIVVQRKEMSEYYPTMLEIVPRREGASPRYGGLQFGSIISDPKELTPQEDMYFSEDIGKKTKLIYQATVGLEKATAGQKTDIIKLEGKKVRGLPEGESVSGDKFVASKQEIIVEDNNKLKIYKVGMRNNTIAFEEKSSDSAIKEFVSSYKTLSGEELFQGKPTTALKNAKGEDVGYLFDTTDTKKPGAAQTYTAFDMKGNIISKIPTDAKTDDNKDLTKVLLDSSYEVKNKNEKIVGLTSQGSQSQELSEKIQSAPEKIKKAIETGGFQVSEITEFKLPGSEKIQAFVADVIKMETVKYTEKDKKGNKVEKSKQESVKYKVLFDINGNVDTNKAIYKLDGNGKSIIADVFKAKVVGDKLVIDKVENIISAESDLAQQTKRKELIDNAAKDGVVRFEKDKKVYELTKQQAEDYAYQQLSSDALIKQQADYKKEVEDITKKYAIEIKDPMDIKDYKENTPAYNAINNNPFYNRDNIIQLLETQKKAELDVLKSKELNSEQKNIIQTKVDNFVKDIKNFDKYEVTKDNAKEVIINGTISVIGDNKAQSNKPIQLTEPQKTVIETIVKENNTQKVEGKDGLKVFDSNPKWENNVSIVNVEGKDTKIIYDPITKTLTTDNPKYTASMENGKVVLSNTPKSTTVTVNTPPTFSDNKEKSPESKEIKDRNFNWYGWKSQPTSLNFKYGTNDTESFSTQFNIKQANIDNRKNEFKILLSELMSSNGNKPAIAPTDDEKTTIGKLQDWLITQEACDCVFNTSDPKKAGLDDGLLGLNTYVALKYTVQKLLHPSELTKEWLAGAFTLKDGYMPLEKKGLERDKKNNLSQIDIKDIKDFDDKEKFGNILNVLQTTQNKQIYINNVSKITFEQVQSITTALNKNQNNPILFLSGLSSKIDSQVIKALNKNQNINIPYSLRT